MRANVIACLLAVAYFACLTLLDSKCRVSSRVRLNQENEPPVDDEREDDGPDAYKTAVVLSVAAAVLSSLFA
jgi:hypothetical protein